MSFVYWIETNAGADSKNGPSKSTIFNENVLPSEELCSGNLLLQTLKTFTLKTIHQKQKFLPKPT